MKYLYKLYIGTEDNSQEKVAGALSTLFEDFTIHKGLGHWVGRDGEPVEIVTYIVEIISSEDEFSMDDVKEIEKILKQKKILTTKQRVKVLI